MSPTTLRRHRWLLALVLIVGAGALVVACSTDSPSEPTAGGQGPGDGGATGQFNVNVTASPGELTLPPEGSAEEPPTSTITIQVRRQDGSVPPNGTTVAVSATNGTLGQDGSTSGFVELFNGRATIEFTPTDDGTAVVQARIGDSVGQATIRVLSPDAFVVTRVQPSSGSPGGGDSVTVFGQGFVQPVRVTFDGVPATVQSVSPTRIAVLTPALPGGLAPNETQTVAVSVTNALGSNEQTDTLASAFTYTRGGSTVQPTILSVTPASGPNEGGTRVRIIGEGFRAPVQVVFGADAECGGVSPGVEATVESVTSTEIVARTPAATSFGQDNRNSDVNIVVTNLNSGFCGEATDAFRYGTPILITAISPDRGPAEGGTLVTIFGQGFDEPVTVAIGGVQQQVISVTGTEIVIRTAGEAGIECDATGGGGVNVTNIESGDSGGGVVFTYLGPESPIITGVSPSSGDEDGGTPVTITGQNFEDPASVEFGDRNGTDVVVNSDTSIDVTTPPFSAFDEVACDDNADGQQGSRFVPTDVDVIVTNLIPNCVSGPGSFIYEPDDTSCRGDVAPEPEEDPECDDGFDNDSDGFIDEEDPECTGPDDDDESA